MIVHGLSDIYGEKPVPSMRNSIRVRIARVLETSNSQPAFWSIGNGSHVSQNVLRQRVRLTAISCLIKKNESRLALVYEGSIEGKGGI